MSKKSGNKLEVANYYDYSLTDPGDHVEFGESSFTCFYDIIDDSLYVTPDSESSCFLEDVRAFIKTLSISKCVKRLIFCYDPLECLNHVN